jgi:hypothetical protein
MLVCGLYRTPRAHELFGDGSYMDYLIEIMDIFLEAIPDGLIALAVTSIN